MDSLRSLFEKLSATRIQDKNDSRLEQRRRVQDQSMDTLSHVD